MLVSFVQNYFVDDIKITVVKFPLFIDTTPSLLIISLTVHPLNEQDDLIKPDIATRNPHKHQGIIQRWCRGVTWRPEGQDRDFS